jgi:hypothetical protein
MIAKAGRELRHQTSSPFHLSQQQPAPVRTQLATIKTGYHLTPSHCLETQLFNGTLCLFHAAASAAY